MDKEFCKLERAKQVDPEAQTHRVLIERIRNGRITEKQLVYAANLGQPLALEDKTLRSIGSIYSHQSDRIYGGTSLWGVSLFNCHAADAS